MIYLKNTNDVLTLPPKDIALDVEKLKELGYQPFDENDYSLYIIGGKIFKNGKFENEPTQEYIQAQKMSKIKRIQSEIYELEQTQMRAIRELTLNKSIDFAMDKLQALDNQIATLRAEL